MGIKCLLVFRKSFSFFYPFLKPLQISFKFRWNPSLRDRRKKNLPNGHLASVTHVEMEGPIFGIRIYRKKAFDFHPPKCLIWVSDIPFATAQEAAPMRKLCVLDLLRSKSQKRSASFKTRVKYILCTGVIWGQQNNEPDAVPRITKNSSNWKTERRDRQVYRGKQEYLRIARGHYVCNWLVIIWWPSRCRGGPL